MIDVRSEIKRTKLKKNKNHFNYKTNTNAMEELEELGEHQGLTVSSMITLSIAAGSCI